MKTEEVKAQCESCHDDTDAGGGFKDNDTEETVSRLGLEGRLGSLLTESSGLWEDEEEGKWSE